MPVLQTWVACLLAVGVLLSTAFFWLVRGLENREADDRAAGMVRKQVEKLEVSMLRSMEVLNGIASLHSARGGIREEEFRAFVRSALIRQPELQALSWNPVVRVEGRGRFEQEARMSGLPDFEIREEEVPHRLRRAGPRDFYVPVRLIEPVARNVDALGYDLISEASRRESVEMAAKSRQPVATAPLHLAQDSERGPGFLVLMPVFAEGGEKGMERSGAFDLPSGFAVAVFRLPDLVRGTLAELAGQGIQAWLLNDGHPVPMSNVDVSRAPSQVQHFEVAGRRWTLAFAPDGEFYRATHRQSWGVLAGGLAFTGFAAFHVLTGARRLRQIAETNEALCLEIVERKKAEQAAASANQAKTDFLASMSHEIRTPLNAILGHAQLMQRDPALSSDQQDSIAGIHVSGRHLLGLINEVLDLAKIEAGRMELRTTTTDLGAMVRGLEATFKPLCARKRIAFHGRMDASESPVVQTDEGKLRQVLINLLGNALKFTAAGGIALQVRQLNGERWRFEVTDTGPGIPADEQVDIFEPFRQGRGTCGDGGSGLGLAIAQRQVELLGGELTLKSEQGLGSSFAFELELPRSSNGRMEEPPPVRGLSPEFQVRALVVDDRRENREVLAGMLRCAGCEVAVAADSPAAVEMSHSLKPDVVFLDLLMPGEGGARCAQRLRELRDRGNSGRMVLIAHTAANVSQHLREAREAGCVECLAKPLIAEEVYSALERHLGVVFERVGTEFPEEKPAPLEGLKITLPEELSARLCVAAELHSTTALKGALKDLRQCGEHGVLLAGHIRHLMRSYDMDGIQKLLSATVQAGGPSRDAAALHE